VLYVAVLVVSRPRDPTSITPRRFAHSSVLHQSVLAGIMVIGDDVDMRTLKFWPLPSPSPAILTTKVDHFPSSPSKVPLGLRTNGFGGNGIGVTFAFSQEGMLYSSYWAIQTAIDPGSEALHGQVVNVDPKILVQLSRKIDVMIRHQRYESNTKRNEDFATGRVVLVIFGE
jgi:hypothetical protein